MLDDKTLQLLAKLGEGLPICSRPYLELSNELGITEQEIICRIGQLQQSGVIKRFGVIVKHAALGYSANAMCVWQIPENKIDEVAQYLLNFSFVTLCYQRPLQSEWQYNLYCMIHGKDEQTVRNQINEINSNPELMNYSHNVLFSRKCFKQRGAIYNPSKLR